MKPSSAFTGLLALAAAATGATLAPRQSSLDSFVASQVTRSINGVLANIGPNYAGAKAGVIIASPSTSNPNYLYTWTRDSALTTKALVERLIVTGDTSLITPLKNYVAAQAILQHVSNPSGDFNSGGLAEPKFNIDETAFTGAWGRPQRDGPALRAITLMNFGNYLKKNGQTSYVTSTIEPLITADLNYVVTYWNQTGFDLWEEVQGSSFFTLASQHRSLVEGSTYFGNANYANTAANVLCFLQSFWSPSQGYIVSNINQNNGRSGKDTNSLLGSIHVYDPSNHACDSATYQPCSDKALSNLNVVVNSFRTIYSINSGTPSNAAVALGRYPEDSYYGGNPWYLSTLAASEQLYDAWNTWTASGSLSVTPTSLAFFQSIVPSATVGIYASGSAQYTTIMAAVRQYADGFLAVVQKYTPASGDLAEEYSRNNGQPLSAVDLTWSYASFLTVAQAKAGIAPPAWNSTGALACGAGGGGGGGGSGTIATTFNVIATTTYGENIFVAGSIPALGSWNTNNAFALGAGSYTSSNHLWTGVINLPPSTQVQYKYIRKETDGRVIYESGNNRVFTTPASGSVTRSDSYSS